MVEIAYPQYHSFVMRLWQETEGSPWRASLHSVTENRIHHFPNLEAAFMFLVNQTGGNRPTESHEGMGEQEIKRLGD